MNTFSHNCFLLILFCFVFASCSKSSNNPGTKKDTTIVTPPVTKPDTTVYIAGSNGTNPILWKNGTPDTLSPTVGTASQVIVSSNDVYVSGVCQEIISYYSPGVLNGPITGQYAYWKNGTQNNMGSFGNIEIAPSISVAGNNIVYSDSSVWVNGTTVTLPGMGSVVSVFAVGNDIYVAGYDSVRDVVYWKNGVLNVVSPFKGHGFTTPLVSCVYVSDNDVYLGGMFDLAVYWKNGTINYLQVRASDPSFVATIPSLFVSNNDVYSAGHLIEFGLPPGVNIAAYWKNGIENDLSLSGTINANTSYSTTSIFKFGSDIYVAGYSTTFTSASTVSLDSAVYWKNGIEKSLTSAGEANSIYVH